jgi:DinB superfamily
VTATTGEVQPRWRARLLAEVQAADDRAEALSRSLSPQQLNWKPTAQEWSIGQCLEHLSMANETYAQPISDALTRRPTQSVQEITPGWFGGWFIRNYIEPSATTRRARSPAKIAPGSHVDRAILDRFLRSNEQVRQLIHRAAGYDVNRIRFRNPYLPIVRFTVGTGLLLMPAHERRHLLQAERIRASAGFPSR